MNDSERDEANRHFMLKKPLLNLPTQFWINFEQKWADTLAEWDDILQKIGMRLQTCTESYSFKQNVTLKNNTE